MAIHDDVLSAALRICRARGGWTFRPGEIVAALPAANAGSLRTHVMSRCCANAPAHHGHRWSYFRRLRRGVYEILPACRRRVMSSGDGGADPVRGGAGAQTIHVEVRESGGHYVAAHPSLATPISGSSIDEVARGVRSAVRERRMAHADPAAPVQLLVELEPDAPDALLAGYERDIDRTLVRQALCMTHEQRLRALQGWLEATTEVRGAARNARRRGRR